MAEFIVTKPCFYLGKRCSPGEVVEFDGKVVPSYLEATEPKRTPKAKAKQAGNVRVLDQEA